MMLIVGSILILASVYFGYTHADGDMLLLWQPFELLIIGGSAFGAYLIANPLDVVKASFKDFVGLLKPSRYNKSLYIDLLTLLYLIFQKTRKDGMMAIENDIDEPEESELFKRFPTISKDSHMVEFITDYLRIIISGNMNAFELESLMDVELDTHHETGVEPSSAVTKVADALPGFGIVAAVLGVVVTMSFVGEAPEVLGAKIAAALVGTFLGIFLAYGFVGPIGNAMERRANENSKFFECAKISLLASVNGYAPQIAVEFGRKCIPDKLRPKFQELEDHLRKSK